MKPRQLTTVAEAVSRIKDGDVFSFNGIGAIGFPDQFFPAMEARFLKEGHPRDLTLYSACGLGTDRYEIQHMAHPGLISCLMVGYILPYSIFSPALKEEKIEGYNLPQGIISMNYRAAAAKRPGFYSKVGLHTFADPRHQGCALNERSTREMVRVEEVDGEEYLFYRTVRPDVCVLRGTTADPNGNITMEKEANVADALAMAMATHNNGGLVFVQVERLSDEYANPQDVRIPGPLVDAIWVSPDQPQTNRPGYSPYYSGLERADRDTVDAMCMESLSRDRYPGKPVSAAERVIARRAALELKDSRMVNLGIGTPMLAASEAVEMGILGENHHISIETGVMGGVPVPDAFGAVINADAIYEMASQFEFYEGGGLDATLVGALEIDGQGNVNVIRKDGILFGAGGFQHVTHAAKKIVVCSRFRRGSGFVVENGQIKLVDGVEDKFVKEVECIAFNAPYFRSLGKKIVYITERCVLELDDDGFVLTEITPGLHPLYSVLQYIPFPVKVAPRLRYMPTVCFDPLTKPAQKKEG